MIKSDIYNLVMVISGDKAQSSTTWVEEDDEGEMR